MPGSLSTGRAVVVALVVAVVILASVLVLCVVPAKQVTQTEVDGFSFVMTQPALSYYPPWGYPCPNNATSCISNDYFWPPADSIGPFTAAFTWTSDHNTTVQFLFFDPFCETYALPTPAPEILYLSNATHGGFALPSTLTMICETTDLNSGPNATLFWWQDGPSVFDYVGSGPVTVTGSMTYTAQLNVPVL